MRRTHDAYLLIMVPPSFFKNAATWRLDADGRCISHMPTPAEYFESAWYGVLEGGTMRWRKIMLHSEHPDFVHG